MNLEEVISKLSSYKTALPTLETLLSLADEYGEGEWIPTRRIWQLRGGRVSWHAIAVLENFGIVHRSKSTPYLKVLDRKALQEIIEHLKNAGVDESPVDDEIKSLVVQFAAMRPTSLVLYLRGIMERVKKNGKLSSKDRKLYEMIAFRYVSRIPKLLKQARKYSSDKVLSRYISLAEQVLDLAYQLALVIEEVDSKNVEGGHDKKPYVVFSDEDE